MDPSLPLRLHLRLVFQNGPWVWIDVLKIDNRSNAFVFKICAHPDSSLISSVWPVLFQVTILRGGSMVQMSLGRPTRLLSRPVDPHFSYFFHNFPASEMSLWFVGFWWSAQHTLHLFRVCSSWERDISLQLKGVFGSICPRLHWGPKSRGCRTVYRL